ncbi:type IV toxin-antitoxin system YeeU family antitoxin, partial [Escherichia coli]|uniref:type IV toxin-antitoxin system YeeU family antitoxin n=1 Tax=Escherichia coli TaxID=562 RepID=UPI0003EF12FB
LFTSFSGSLVSRISGAVQAFPLLMKQLELMLTSGELNPRHQHTVTLYAKGLTCKADTLGSGGYVYLAVYPTPETKK